MPPLAEGQRQNPHGLYGLICKNENESLWPNSGRWKPAGFTDFTCRLKCEMLFDLISISLLI